MVLSLLLTDRLPSPNLAARSFTEPRRGAGDGLGVLGALMVRGSGRMEEGACQERPKKGG